MIRIKRGINSKKKHNKIIKLSKGFINRRKNTYKISKQSIIKSLTYSYYDRKKRKKKLNSYWVTSINYVLRYYNYNYSSLKFYFNFFFFNINNKSLYAIFSDYCDFIKLLNLIFFYYTIY